MSMFTDRTEFNRSTATRMANACADERYPIDVIREASWSCRGSGIQFDVVTETEDDRPDGCPFPVLFSFQAVYAIFPDGERHMIWSEV